MVMQDKKIKNQGRVKAQSCFHFVFQVSGVLLWISGCEFIFLSFLQLGNCSLQGVNPHGFKPCCVQRENLYRDFFFPRPLKFLLYFLTRGTKKSDSYPESILVEKCLKYLAYIAWENTTKRKKKNKWYFSNLSLSPKIWHFFANCWNHLECLWDWV